MQMRSFPWSSLFWCENQSARVTPTPPPPHPPQGKNMNKNLDKIWPQMLQNKANLTVLGPCFCSYVCLVCGVWGFTMIPQLKARKPTQKTVIVSHLRTLKSPRKEEKTRKKQGIPCQRKKRRKSKKTRKGRKIRVVVAGNSFRKMRCGNRTSAS